MSMHPGNKKRGWIIYCTQLKKEEKTWTLGCLIKESDNMVKYFPTGTWNYKRQWVPQLLPEVVSKGWCESSHIHRHICSATACHTPPPAAGTREGKGLRETGTCGTSEEARCLQDPQSHSGILSFASVTLHSPPDNSQIKPHCTSPALWTTASYTSMNMKEKKLGIFLLWENRVKGDCARCPVSSWSILESLLA